MVDVDLGAHSADILAGELDGLSRAAHPSALDAATPHQAALDQLGDQAGDRRLVEAEVGGEPGARARAAVAEAAEHEGEVGASERHLVGRGRAVQSHLAHQPTSSDAVRVIL